MKATMTSQMHTTSVPVFHQMLGGLSDILAKAEAHAEHKKLEPAALLQARLYPDMFTLTQQVQVACDFAASVSARLAGVDVPTTANLETSYADLRARIAATQAFIGGLSPQAFEGSAARDIVLRPGTPKERRLSGQAYLVHYGLPQFFFHVTTAYALLRHNGLEVGKKDYMGAY
jgi:uncharacterized protein